MRTLKTLDAAASFSAPPAIAQKSPWHSPVPYLFGGLAAMLGLIAFALLLLACSYWRFSAGNSNNEENDGESRDIERGPDGKSDTATAVKVVPVFEDKIVVIMAGDVKPTFLATPMSSRASSFGDGAKKNENFGKGMEEIVEKPKTEMVTDDNHEEDQTERSHEAAQENLEQN